MSNLVSIIMPVYPSDKFSIKLFINTLDSILNQTYDNIELVVVLDGGGNKKNIKRVLDILKSKNISCYALDRNYGAQAAMNFGFTVSKGTYVAFHDQDDVSRKDRIQMLMDNIGDDNVIGSYIYSKKPEKTRVKGFDQDSVIRKFEDSKILNNLVKTPAHFGSLLIHRDLFNQVGGFENVLVADSLFCIKLNLLRYYGYNKKLRLLEEPLFTWVRHSGSNTSGKKDLFSKEVHRTRGKISKVAKQIIASAGKPDEIKKLLNIRDNIKTASNAKYTRR